MYKFIEDVAMADVAFEASGKTLPFLFREAALAVTNTMVKDLKSVKQKVMKEVNLESDNLEFLFHNFLQQIVLFKDIEQLLFSKFVVKIQKQKERYSLNAKFYGEKLDPKRHELLVDVKAITWHLFELKKDKMWRARVILDI